MVVNDCGVATEVDEKNGIESYDADVECSTDKPQSEIVFRQKVMASSFNPYIYDKN